MRILSTCLVTLLYLSLQNSATAQNETSNLTLFEPLAIQELLQEFTTENSKHQTIKGFRVQIYNGSKKEAQDVRAAFLKAYPEQPVALTYETPEYKVQVGNFRTRVEAEALLSVIRATFKGCFVVKSLIDLPEVP